MPGINGYETCRRLKKLPDTKEIPVIFMTALAETDHKLRAFEAGGVDYITKPFQREEALARIAVHLQIRELAARLQESNTLLEKRVAERTDELARANRELLAEVLERKLAEEALKEANEELETRVAERTRELEGKRAELEQQNAEMRETYRRLEQETKQRIGIMEELREKDTLLIQQSRMAAMGEMLGNIAHFWRQPLNVLGLTVQELGLAYECGRFSKQLLDDNIAKAMEVLQHLSQTITEFRNLSAPDRDVSRFSVAEVIARTVALVEENFRQRGIALETATTGEPQIEGYPNEYAQVLLNILINARDALREHRTADARITVRASEENGRSVLTVTDNAGGISLDIIQKIFDPFFTTKQLGQGSGVGLFTAKAIIEKKMGGRLTVRNVEGGAEFRIEV